jgi:protein-disulfide isomerase
LIDRDYVQTGKVRIDFKNRAALAQESVWAAESALCAGEQEKYWEYHDALYEALYAGNATVFSKEGFKTLAGSLGLQAQPFNACVDSGKYTKRVQEESQESQNRGVTGTPTFFVNDTKIVGAQSYETFKAAIEAELAKP